MKLHEAMRFVLLQQPNLTATTRLLADEIARFGLYRRQDGAVPEARQVNARVRNYPHLFRFVSPGVVELTPSE